MRYVALAVLLVACSDPPFKIVYRVADGVSGQSCGTSECGQLQMACDSVLHVRVLSPSDPNVPYVSVCREIPKNNPPPLRGSDLCAIANIDLEGPASLPRETLEVQVTVWPRAAVLDENGRLDCGRTPVEFDAAGFPETLGPAFGGRAFYAPGDAEVVVTLGCTNVSAVNSPTCTGENDIVISATVKTFADLPDPVSPDKADNLIVDIGEPDSSSELLETELAKLTLFPGGSSWSTSIENEFDSTSCVRVIDPSDPGSATTVRCKFVNRALRMLETSGVLIDSEKLDEILTALGLTNVPLEGITVGKIHDDNGEGVAGIEVVAAQGTVQYINADITGIEPGATRTTESGLFVSRDAPYPTTFTQPASVTVQPAIGGLVKSMITVVLFDPPQTGG